MRKRLGEILIDAGVIDQAQLRAALVEAATAGTRVGELLVERGACSEYDIVRALATQLGVPLAPLETVVIIPERVLSVIPPQIAKERRVLPLFLDAKTGLLDVAIADPTDYELLDELRFLTGHSIRPMVARSGEIDEAIAQFYVRPSGPVSGMQARGGEGSSPPVEAHSTRGVPTAVPQPVPVSELDQLHELMVELAERVGHSASLEVLSERLDRVQATAERALATCQGLVEALTAANLLDLEAFQERARGAPRDG